VRPKRILQHLRAFQIVADHHGDRAAGHEGDNASSRHVEAKRSVRAGLPGGACRRQPAAPDHPMTGHVRPEWVLPVAGGVCARPGWCRIKDAHPDERTTA
jgi:hypothetical protein